MLEPFSSVSTLSLRVHCCSRSLKSVVLLQGDCLLSVSLNSLCTLQNVLYLPQKHPAAPDVWLQLLDHCLSDPSSTPAHPGAQHPTALDGLAALLTGDRAEAAQAALMQYQQVRLVRIGDMVGELVDHIELNKDWQQRQLDKAAEQGVSVEPLQQALRTVYEQLKEMLKLYPEDDGLNDGFAELEFVAGCDTDSYW
jgi:hypothetical protein